MDYTKKLIKAAKDYLRASTCNCKYNGGCPQEVLQSLIDAYKPPLIIPTKKKKGSK